MRAAIYLRVSTDDQAKEGYGLEAQLTKCEAMATVKGWEITGVYRDEGISGTKDESGRPGLAALIHSINAQEVDALIVYALDRIGRSTKLVLRIVEAFDAGGVELVSCKESLDTSTASGRFVLRMFASLAELERDSIVERTTSGRNQRGKMDGEKGGRVPMGYVRTFENGKAVGVEVDEERAALVRLIFAERGRGQTLEDIAASLNADGHTTARGGQWHASSVRVILANEENYRGGARGESSYRWPVILTVDGADKTR